MTTNYIITRSILLATIGDASFTKETFSIRPKCGSVPVLMETRKIEHLPQKELLDIATDLVNAMDKENCDVTVKYDEQEKTLRISCLCNEKIRISD